MEEQKRASLKDSDGQEESKGEEIATGVPVVPAFLKGLFISDNSKCSWKKYNIFIVVIRAFLLRT